MGKKGPPLTDAEKRKIDELRQLKCKNNFRPIGVRHIHEMTGISRDRISKYLGLAQSHSPKRKQPANTRFVTPAHVWAERDRAWDFEPTINHLLLGDPPPTRSAGGRKNGNGEAQGA